MTENWYIINDIHKIDTPAVVIYPNRVRENIDTLKKILPDTERLRPHVKTHKSANITHLLLDAGIEKFKCATIAEAEMLAIAGAADVLLAYQPVGPKAERLLRLVHLYPDTTFSCLIDDPEIARQLDAVAQRSNHCMPVYLDLNVGMNRTGIPPGDQAVELYMALQTLQGILPVGLHAYDGHIRDKDFAIRTKRCDEAFKQVEQLRQRLREKGADDPVIIAGGSPTFPIHSKRPDVECSPGTFIFWDKGYHDILPEMPFRYAALVITRIISKPTAGTICIDLGHKAIASENPLSSRVSFLNAGNLEPIGHSEEHMTLKTTHPNDFRTGDVLYGVPYHVCPTCALYDTAVTITDNKVNDCWSIDSRGRKINV